MALDSLGKNNISVHFSYTSELIAAANMVASRDPELVGLEPAWVDAQKAALPPGHVLFLELSEGIAMPTMSLCDYTTRYQEWDSWDELEARIRAESIVEFLYLVFNADLSREMMARFVENPSLSAVHTDELSFFSTMESRSIRRIFEDPERFRSVMLDFVRSNQTGVFAGKLAELQPAYANAMAFVENRLKTQAPLEVAEELRRKRYQGLRDFSSYTFVPTWFRGKNSPQSYIDGKFSIAFSLQFARDEWVMDARSLSDQLKVLADPSRLEIIRILGNGHSYATELAGRMGVTTATVSRHLDQLRSAGIVREDKADSTNIKHVHLNRRTLEAIMLQFSRFSRCGPDQGTSAD